MPRNIRKHQGTSSNVATTAARVIEFTTTFHRTSRPDAHTGKEPYRIGWGRSIGRDDPDLEANEAEEGVWLRSRMEFLLQEMDQTLERKELVKQLVAKFKQQH